MDNQPTNNTQGEKKPSNRPPRSRSGSGGGQRRSSGGSTPKGSGGLSIQKSTVSRGAAVRAQKRSQMDAQRVANQYLAAPAAPAPRERRANYIDDNPRLRLIGLGGMDGGGSKNMLLVEYMNDAVIMDCGNDLGVDLPGINYGIADTTYLEVNPPQTSRIHHYPRSLGPHWWSATHCA